MLKGGIGLYNKNFQMAGKEINEEERCDVKRYPAVFKITAGPMLFEGKQFKETFVMEIHYEDSVDSHRQQLGAFSFGSYLFLDYAEQAEKVAAEFCKKKGFKISKVLNSYPEYQAIIYRESEAKKPKLEFLDLKKLRDDVQKKTGYKL